MRCLTSSRMSMFATVLKIETQLDKPSEIPTDTGNWSSYQDPITGQFIRNWEPVEDDPDTVEVESSVYDNIPCIARGLTNGGIRAAGTTERYDAGEFDNVDYIQFWVPAYVNLTKRDQITNIRDRSGKVVWVEEENPLYTGQPKPSVFNVNGVTPLFNAFNQHIEDYVLLERAENE